MSSNIVNAWLIGAFYVILIVSALLLIITIVSGGLASLNKPLSACVLLLHKFLPYATVAATLMMLYGLMGKR